MKVIKDTYLELCSLIEANVLDADGDQYIKFMDLWHNQINFLDDEYAFPFPCVFFEFTGDSPTQMSNGVQQIGTTFNLFFALETLADSYQGSSNQESALLFTEIMDKLNVVLQKAEYNSMSKLRFNSYTPMEAPSSIILYRLQYKCEMLDTSVKDSKETVKKLADYTLQNDEEPYEPSNTFEIPEA